MLGLLILGQLMLGLLILGLLILGRPTLAYMMGVYPDKGFASDKCFASFLRYIGNFIEDLSPYSITYLIVTGDFSSPVRRQLILICPNKNSISY